MTCDAYEGHRFVVRRHWSDSESETISQASSYNRAYDQALTFLVESGRDYECFDVVELDDAGHPDASKDWGCVSWEPRG